MWDDARAYDLATGSFRDDIVYWQGLVAEYQPRRVLDLACGTGRITLSLADIGTRYHDDFSLVGVDMSASFLRRAAEKGAAAGLGERVRWIEGDMRSFALEEAFDLIILGYNGLAWVDTIDDHLALLGAVRRHLAPGGYFAIDNHTPYLPLLAEARMATFPVVRRELDWCKPAPGIARFSSFYVTSRYDPISQTEYSTHYWEIYHEDGQRETQIKDLTWHHYFPHELQLLLRQSGLTPVARYGTYDRAPFDESSAQYLWVMTAATETP
jgi:ubiquinone/menaquinone biosynthesis C-methylase UbiE